MPRHCPTSCASRPPGRSNIRGASIPQRSRHGKLRNDTGRRFVAWASRLVVLHIFWVAGRPAPRSFRPPHRQHNFWRSDAHHVARRGRHASKPSWVGEIRKVLWIQDLRQLPSGHPGRRRRPFCSRPSHRQRQSLGGLTGLGGLRRRPPPAGLVRELSAARRQGHARPPRRFALFRTTAPSAALPTADSAPAPGTAGRLAARIAKLHQFALWGREPHPSLKHGP
jgi:hypothetical protein